ncbi:MAG: hypothetical protein LBG88_03635 [Christensenellaceae bacterium]|nr:hypothetical protein [Christensenellaceae bacterium]
MSNNIHIPSELGNLNCFVQEPVSREIQRMMLVEPVVRFQPVETFEPVRLPVGPVIEPFPPAFPVPPFPPAFPQTLPENVPCHHRPFEHATPFITGECGRENFLCSQAFTGERLERCCGGTRHGHRERRDRDRWC